jgi:hypothetical protein
VIAFLAGVVVGFGVLFVADEGRFVLAHLWDLGDELRYAVRDSASL